MENLKKIEWLYFFLKQIEKDKEIKKEDLDKAIDLAEQIKDIFTVDFK